MKRAAIIVFLFLASFVVSCGGPANYPITLSYQPLKHYEKTGGLPVAVAVLLDTRHVANKREIGEKDGSLFISLIDEPAAALSKGLAANLENRGYTVKRVNEVWDGDIASINPDWGPFVIGGELDNISLKVKQRAVKTTYECSVKYTLSVADAKSKELLHKEKFEVANSYVTVPIFSSDKAEELINQTLSDAVERGLADIDKYLKNKK